MFGASNNEFRSAHSACPCSWFVPLFVLTLTTAPTLCPELASNGAVCTLNSATAAEGGMNPTRVDPPSACVFDTPSSVNSLLYVPAPSVAICEFLLMENDPDFASRMSVVLITPGASCTSVMTLPPN